MKSLIFDLVCTCSQFKWWLPSDRSIKVLFSLGLLSAFMLGVFELLFPIYLNYRNVSLFDMGLILSISTLAISFFRIFVGEYSDVYGRKRVYLASCAFGAIAKSVLSLSLGKIEILLGRFLDDLYNNLRNSVNNVMLYEKAREAYAKIFSWSTTSNFLLQAAGNISFATLLLYFGYSGCFFLLAGMEIVMFFGILLYKEDHNAVKRKISIREAYSFKINRNLMILALSSAIATLGFGIAHGSYLLPLYFGEKYGLDLAQISIVSAIHRLAYLTTPVSTLAIRKLGIIKTYILSTLAYAISFLAIGLITFPIFIFMPIFLIHDLLGGGIRQTAMNVIVQSQAADGRRGREANTFNTIQTPMSVIAPTIAGILAAKGWDNIFIVGGLLYIVSLLIFCLFFKANALTSQEAEAKGKASANS